MLLGVEVTDPNTMTIEFRKCVEMNANGQPLPTPAHHHSIHTGNAGGSFVPGFQGPLFQAGNWVIPLSPFHGIPFESCDDFESGMSLLSP